MLDRGILQTSLARSAPALAGLGLVLVMVMLAAGAHGASMAGGPPDRVDDITDRLLVTLSPDTLDARVTYTQNGPVMFNGTVDISPMVPGHRYTVTLTTSAVWPAIVSPGTIVIDGTGPRVFYVTVVVPPRTSCSEESTLIVQAAAKASGMPVLTASATATVTVAAYHSVEVGVEAATAPARRGGELTRRLNVTNFSNFPLRFQLQAVDPPDGVSLEETDQLTIDTGQTAFVDVVMRIGSDAKTGSTTLRLKVIYSEAADSPEEFGCEMRFTVEPALGGTGSIVLVTAVTVAACAGVLLVLVRRARRKGTSTPRPETGGT